MWEFFGTVTIGQGIVVFGGCYAFTHITVLLLSMARELFLNHQRSNAELERTKIQQQMQKEARLQANIKGRRG